MTYNNKAANNFKKIMGNTIKQWQKYEESFYNTNIVPECIKDPMLKDLVSAGKGQFPHRLWLVWIYGWEFPFDMTISELEDMWQSTHFTFTIPGKGYSVEKGKQFENILAQRVESDEVLKKLSKILSGQLKHVGSANQREDFLLTDTFSLDVKYSDILDDRKFKNIIKPFGEDMYSFTVKIQEGIMRSMYKVGASEGQFLPKAMGRTKHKGILKYDKKAGYQEVTQEDYDQYGLGPIPSLRKNIIYLYNDDGYWASVCLEKVTDWAADHLEELGFTDYSRDPNYKSYSAYEFWGFGGDDWKRRQTWYGKSQN